MKGKPYNTKLNAMMKDLARHTYIIEGKHFNINDNIAPEEKQEAAKLFINTSSSRYQQETIAVLASQLSILGLLSKQVKKDPKFGLLGDGINELMWRRLSSGDVQLDIKYHHSHCDQKPLTYDMAMFYGFYRDRDIEATFLIGQNESQCVYFNATHSEVCA